MMRGGARERRRRRYFDAIEALEPRQLMTVDLTGAWATPVGGASGSVQTATLHITNNGTTKFSKSLQVDVYVVPDGSVTDPEAFDPTGLTPVRFGKTLSIAAGGTKDLVMSLPLSAALESGDYDLVAVIDPTAKSGDTNTANNVAVSSVITVTTPEIDLNPTFTANSTLPAGILAGKTTKGTVHVTLSNLGSAAINSNTTVSIEVVARPVGAIDDSQDIVLNTRPVNVSVLNLASGGNNTVNVPVQFLSSMANGSFTIVAIADSGNALAETDEGNNEATLANTTVTVGPGFVDLGAGISNSTLPASVVNTSAANGNVTVTISNLGNIAVGPNHNATVTVTLHPASGPDVTFTRTMSISGLKANGVKHVPLTLHIPAGMALGDFEIIASVTPDGTLVESNVSNNSFTSESIISFVPADVAELGVTDVSDSFGLTTSGGSSGNGTVTVENLGTTLAKGNVNVQFFASPTGDHAEGVLIGQKFFSLNLTSGRSSTLTVPVTMPFPFTTSTYTIFAQIVPVGLDDVDPNNNIIDDKAVTLTNNLVDLQIASATNPFTGTILGGSSGTGTVKVQNLGNITGSGKITVTFFATANGTIDGSAIQLGQATSNTLTLAAGQTSNNIGVNLTMPDPLITTTYKIVARITSTGFNDAFTEDNVTGVLATVTVLP
jgi:uncharacterized membrane protein